MGTHHIEFRVKVPCEIYWDEDMFVSSCPPLDVFSQGETEQQALDNLVEALTLFLESCYEHGNLDEVLKECGFEAVTSESLPTEMSAVEVPLLLAARA